LNYVLTTAAEADLRGIIRYTRTQWGAVQVRRYMAKLQTGMANVAAGKGIFKQLDALYPKLRVAVRSVTTLAITLLSESSNSSLNLALAMKPGTENKSRNRR